MAEILGSRAPMGVTWTAMRKDREDWCDYKQHYVNEIQRPIFTVHDSRWWGRRPRHICLPCYLSYPKDSKYGEYYDDVPDHSKPCYTTGTFNFKRSVNGQ